MSEVVKKRFTECEWVKDILGRRKEFQETPSETLGMNGPLKPRVKFALQIASEITPKGKALDVGCGSQLYFAHGLEKLGYEVYCVDVLPRQFERFVLADAHRLPFRSNVFHLVNCGSVLEYLFYPELFVEETFRITDDGGYFILHVPEKPDWGKWPLIARGFTRNEIESMMSDAGFEIMGWKKFGENLVEVGRK